MKIDSAFICRMGDAGLRSVLGEGFLLLGVIQSLRWCRASKVEIDTSKGRDTLRISHERICPFIP